MLNVHSKYVFRKFKYVFTDLGFFCDLILLLVILPHDDIIIIILSLTGNLCNNLCNNILPRDYRYKWAI